MNTSIVLSILFITALLLFGCDQGGELVSLEGERMEDASLAKTAAEDKDDTGTLHERSFMHDGTLRSYLLYVPAAYDGQEDWPLVINYHGFNVDASFQIVVSQMNAVADAAAFLIAYPQGLLTFNPFSGTTGPG